VVIVTDARSWFLACACAGGLSAGPRAMPPCRFKAVEPGALARPLAQPPTTAAGALDPLVMGLASCLHVTADMPGGMIPDDAERRLACIGPSDSQPPEILGGDMADGLPVDHADQHGLGVRPPPSIISEGCGVGSIVACRVLDQAHRIAVCPGMPVRVGHAAPPDVVGAPSHPGGIRVGESDQAIPGCVVRVDCGAGLVSQGWARFPCAPSCCMARRMGASRRGRAVRPGS
jgi:hypothetical protein